MKKNNDDYLWRMQNILIITWILMLSFALIARAEYIEVYDSIAVVDTIPCHWIDENNPIPADTMYMANGFCHAIRHYYQRVCHKVDWPLTNRTIPETTYIDLEITQEQLLKEWKPFEVIYNGCDTIGWEYIGRAGSPCCDSIPVLKCDTVK